MKYFSLLLAVALLATFASSAQAAIVFSDDFSEADGTLLNGKSPDVGGTWAGATQFTVQGGAAEGTSPGFLGISGGFTALGAGEILTFNFTTEDDLGNFHGDGFGGFDLFVGGTPRFFIGDGGGASTDWRIVPSGDATTQLGVSGAQSGVLTYNFDTGAYQLDLGTATQSGTADAGLALDSVRLALNGNNTLEVDTVSIDISAIPEPSSFVLAGLALGLCGLTSRRRRMAA